jgi:peptidoglycan/xylan/chitin deacetylase (PgdA/CDA1 family)
MFIRSFFLLLLLMPFAGISQTNQKTVVLTFDDAPQSHYSFVAPLLKQYGFGATFYVCEFPGVYPDSTISMNWRQIGELSKMGFEIGNHTWHHKHVPGLKEQALVKELAYIEHKCDSLGIPEPTSFCYPAYVTDTLAVRVLKQRGYTNARTGNDRPYDPGKDDPFYIPSYTISKDKKDLFYKALQDAKAGQIVVFCFHGIPDNPHPWVSNEPGTFKAYMQYLHDHHYRVIAMRDLNFTKSVSLVKTGNAVETHK